MRNKTLEQIEDTLQNNNFKQVNGWWEYWPTDNVCFYAEPDRGIYTMNIMCYCMDFLVNPKNKEEKTYRIYHDFDQFIKDSQQTIFVL